MESYRKVNQDIVDVQIKKFFDLCHVEKAGCYENDFFNKFSKTLERYFWNYYQYGFVPTNPAMFKALGFSQERLKEWLSDFTLAQKEQLNGESFTEKRSFEWQYNIYALLSDDQFYDIFFTYHSVTYSLNKKESEQVFLEKFHALLRKIPYYSPYLIKAVTDLDSFMAGNQGKISHSTTYTLNYSLLSHEIDIVYTPLNHVPIHLLDTLLQFIFQHIQHIGGWNAEGRNQPTQTYLQNELEQLEQAGKILVSLFSTLPKQQQQIYKLVTNKKGESKKTVLWSLVFYNFKTDFIRSIQSSLIGGEVNSDSEKKELSDAQARKLYESFFDFLESGFKEHNVKIKSKRIGKTDNWELINSQNNEVIISGGPLRSNYRNHMEKIDI
ncbi:hypothetical protein QSV37_08890 [Acinetobacter sp. VNK23]|uniref:hypothetical protein n=1 Tax=Acinetobacter thutiue TaxID=2998078 RepID=UPI0025766E93|nr:hypothetical protein [Acinetobacter thutiue]MDM1020416.1 hypothetical protein [Acinetobacter thutiue]